MKYIIITAALIFSAASAQTVSSSVVDSFGVELGATTPVYFGLDVPFLPEVNAAVSAQKYLGATPFGNLNLSAKLGVNDVIYSPNAFATLQLTAQTTPTLMFYTSFGTTYYGNNDFTFVAKLGAVFGTPARFYGEK